MSITPIPTPDPDEVSRGLADIEHFLGDHAPASPTPVESAETLGETRRVRELRAEVAEAHRVVELQDDPAPFLVDTSKVRKRRTKAAEAARLHELAQDPAARAWQAARMRRVLVVVAIVSLALALAWSTAGVHAFASEGAEDWSPSWVFAWFVEPFMSLGLLFVVGARTYMATRGQPIESRTLVRIEHLLLALTLGMNAWPHLPGVTTKFTVSALVLHLLGPIVAVIIVTALPVVLAAFTGLDHGAASTGGTEGLIRANADAKSGDEYTQYTPAGVGFQLLVAHARRMIATGELPASPGIHKIRRALGCGVDTARDVQKALGEGAS